MQRGDLCPIPIKVFVPSKLFNFSSYEEEKYWFHRKKVDVAIQADKLLLRESKITQVVFGMTD